MKITIRDAKPADAAIIARYNTLMARETEGRHLDPDSISRGVTCLLQSPARGRYLIAETDGRTLGQCMITYEWSDWRCGDFWWIQSVYVEPEFRRKGVFSTMYSHILKLADESGMVAGVRLYVKSGNVTAQQTYMKLGLSRASYLMFECDFTKR